MKVYVREIILTAVIYLFALQRALTTVWTGFNYIDELFALYAMMDIVISIMKRGWGVLSKKEHQLLLLWVVIFVLGVVGNVYSKLIDSWFFILIDAISMVKVWLSYYVVIMINRNERYYDRVIQYSAVTGRILTWIMLICLIISQFADIGMTSDVSIRYGIASFQFIYNVPGNLCKLFYFLIPVFIADLNYKNTIWKKIVIGIACIVWASTMRARSFAFIAAFIIVYVYFFTRKGNTIGQKLKGKIKPWHIAVLICLTFIITKDQIVFYFTTSSQARSVLLRYGIKTMMNYFPIGAGFGTFGSDIASTHYSQLYTQYGFNRFYGMRMGEEYFLNDNYWPMIMGQFGFVGLILVLYIVFTYSFYVIRLVKNNRYIYVAMFLAMGFLMASSIASKSYSEYSSICVFMLAAVFVQKGKRAADH